MSSSAINQSVFQAKVSGIQNQADSTSIYSNGVWSFKNSTALTSVTITDAGNVGVGATTTSAKLTIKNPSATGEQQIINIQSAASTDAIAKVTFNQTTDVLNIANFTNTGALVFGTGGSGTERMRIDASGRVGINLSPDANVQLHVKGWTNGYAYLATSPTTSTPIFQVESENSGTTPAIAGTLRLAKGTNNRSVNASGTVNANGADYAEYMPKAGDFTILKGEICGINADGKLVKVFSEAVAFVVKSTNPSYVGNDNWFTEQRPCDENEKESLKDSEKFKAWESRMEAARQLVDRIAFCGQVPVNVLGATPGQWIIPVEDNGGIKGEAVSSPSFEQYQKAIGKVIAVEEDGRARIIVKIA